VNKERLKEIKDSVNFQREILKAHNMETLCIDEEQELIEEIERLNNIINKGIEAINVYQNEKTLSVGYQDLKRIRGILQGNEFDLQMFEEYLKELGEKNENE